MGEILGRGQHELAQGEVAGVEIQRPRFRFSGDCPDFRLSENGTVPFGTAFGADIQTGPISGKSRIFLLPAVGRQLDFDQPLRVEGPLEGKKHLFQARAHRSVIVGGLFELEPRALPRDRAPRLDGLPFRPIQRIIMPAERGQQKQNGGVGSWFAHGFGW